MFLMQMRAIVLVFSCAALSLTLTASVSRPAPQQAEEQRRGEEAKEKTAKKKIADDPQVQSFTPPARGLKGLGREFLIDQEQIWTSPSKIRFSDTQWLVPLSGITAGLFVTDSDFSRHLSKNSTTISHYKTLSNAGVGALIGGAGGMWLLGHVRHNEHWSETGFLAGEAALNSLVAVEAFKYSLRRQRPYQGDGSGPFFQSSGTSFPSEHAAAAWSVAGVVAHEYPGPLMKIAAYGLASLVDYSRVRGRQHFPSDVFVGSIVGNLIAQNVYSRHHDSDLGGGEWRSISQLFRGDGDLSPRDMGSPYVPMDSWVYPAFDRLAALGYVNSGIFGMRPWTRLECARLLNEASENLNMRGSKDTGVLRLQDSLAQEFSNDRAIVAGRENSSLQVESFYTRVTGISGTPLIDGFHFGQTVLNDFGRPFAEGFNAVEGFSGWAASGRLTAYIRGEFQRSPSSPPLSESARQLIAISDANLPVPPATVNPAVNQFQLLDAYVAINFENWQLAFGKQSLWWGPSVGGPMIFSDNAVPVTMFRIDRVSPFKLPWFLGVMGPARWEFFLGRLSGHDFVVGDSTGLVGQWGHPLADQPFIVGQKLNFKPTPNFEFGVDYTRVTGGPGQPFTFRQFFYSMFGLGNGLPGSRTDPGDVRSGVDFSYKIPKMRNWLTFYGDAFTEDEYSPLGYPRKSAFQGGIYAPRIPGVPKLDLRVEGGSTSPVDFPECPGCFYQNIRFVNSYTNLGNLMGTWIGRASQGEQAWSTYWLTSRNTIQFNYRHRKIDGQFAPGGGTVNDGSVKATFWLRETLKLSGSVQYEKWNIPVLAQLPRSNVSTSVELSFWPRNWGLQAK
jgi:membrane-associated phospholipid phosphatase